MADTPVLSVDIELPNIDIGSTLPSCTGPNKTVVSPDKRNEKVNIPPQNYFHKKYSCNKKVRWCIQNHTQLER